MSRWQGPSYKGARKALQAAKRHEADRRNTATADLRRRRNRLMFQRATVSMAEFTAAMEELVTAAGTGRDQLLRLGEGLTEAATPGPRPDDDNERPGR